MVPLPSVENVCFVLMQEETQRDILQTDKTDDNIMAMFGRSSQPRQYKPSGDRNVSCSACGLKGHSGDKYWSVVGYPKRHTSNSRPSTSLNKQKKPGNQQWTSGSQLNQRMAAALEQLAKLLNPQMQAANYCKSETDDELDHFSGMIICCQATSNSQDWIIDSGATDHMTSHVSNLKECKFANALHINLPNGSQATLSHIGTVVLPTGLLLCVPKFQHNLLSVQKLIKYSDCAVHFFTTHYLILDNMTSTLVGVGEAKQGLYYMVDHLSKALQKKWFSALDKKYLCFNAAVVNSSSQESLELWHNMLSHMHVSNMQHIPVLSHFPKKSAKLDENPFTSIPNSPIVNSLDLSNESHSKTESLHFNDVAVIELAPPLPRRSFRLHTTPKWHVNYVSNQTTYISNLAYTQVTPDFQFFVTNLTHNPDIVHYKVDVQQEHWIKAMNLELEALEQNDTWEVTELPSNKTSIASKQKAGVDYDQTFAYVAKLIIVRTLLVVASIKNWEACQMDVSNKPLQEDVYMKMPQGYTHLDYRISHENVLSARLNSKLVCKLKESIYGLKQSPKNWFSKLTTTLLNSNFLQSKADYSFFTKIMEDTITVCLIYVDDLLICGNSALQIQNLKVMLSSHFNMKDLGALRYFFGNRD
ncbi:uncharacterized protein LOC141691373 [Apium graveolens]|uniref:uncharacterized protein LOC141691373 n=1 Tax=Apium graveolens TaxID=4045 RepID=UPI003D7A3052